jgi:hypothetical protein
VHQLDEIAMLARRQYPYGSPMEQRNYGAFQFEVEDKDVRQYFKATDTTAFDDFEVNRPKEIVKEGLSEYILYTIEGTETIGDGWGKRLPSFAADGVKVESLFKYDEERWGANTILYVSFVNDEEHKLGQTPLPDGMVRIYGQAGDGKGPGYVGATSVKYIPVNEKVEMNLGRAQEVAVEPRLMGLAMENIEFSQEGDVKGWDEVRQWQIEVRNTRRMPAKIEMTRGFGTNYWTLTSDAAWEKYDATHAKFTVKLAAGEKMTIAYSVRTYHGTRQGNATGGM